VLRGLAETLAPLVAGLLALVGVLVAGRGARAALECHAAWQVRVGDVECTAPPGLTRAEFLTEVQYLGQIPDRLPLLSPATPPRLSGLFCAHPWVESVGQVRVMPRRRVRVDLTLRRPVLAVSLPHALAQADGSVGVETRLAGGGTLPCRAVDGHGILLPAGAVQDTVPVLQAEVRAPAGSPGTDWGDPRVRQAAALAAFLRPHLQRLHLGDATLESVGDDFVFRRPLLRVAWGRAPGQETAQEARAAVKLQRLLDLAASAEGLEGHDVDARPVGGLRHAWLPAVARP
jgi:hypothetical protein